MIACAKFITGGGGLPAIHVETPHSVAEIYLHGAHVTKFQKHGDLPLLWLSEKSLYDANSAIRGGIPVVFPWFGGRDGKQLKHGFARIKPWRTRDIIYQHDGTVTVRLELPAFPDDPEFADLEACYTINVGESLELSLEVHNRSEDRPVSFEECLHTYFSVLDISSVSVHGLEDCKFLDTVGGMTERPASGSPITIGAEVDRIYSNTRATVEIRDEKLRRKIRVQKQGSQSTVVWNPWIAKSKEMADFGDEEYLEMLCVESGNIRANAITLAPGQTSKMTMWLSSSPL